MRGPEPLKPKLPRGIEKQAFNQINFFLANYATNNTLLF